MLSRIAESLFWIGRYVDRGDNAARVRDLHVKLLLEDARVDALPVDPSLLQVMHCAYEGDVTRDIVLDYLAYDPAHSSSIAGTLTAARENARRAREVISTEVWESLNATRQQLASRTRTRRPYTFFEWVRERAAVVWGLSGATTSRDDTWLFMDLGRSLERADMIARLLMTRSLAGTIGANWTTLLRSCAAHEAYLRRVRSLVSEERAAEFLLIDRMFPRSIAYNLTRAERIIAELDPDAQRRSPSAQARFALGRARSDLEYRQVREILDDLPGQMKAVQVACAEASDLISERFFVPAVTVWTQEAV